VARLLVTGGAGFIGANFVHYWAGRHPDDALVVLDALTYAGNRQSLAPLLDAGRVAFVHGDICDAELVAGVLRTHDIDTIVNFAAESHVDRSIDGPAVFVRSNVLGTQALLECARHAWLGAAGPRRHRFHQISTDEVYGSLGPADPPFSETTPYAPNSPYAASKAAADHLVRAYTHTYGLACTISNCSNNYGPLQFPEKLIPLALTRMLHGRPVPIYGDGRNVRDWLHVEDHCRGIEAILLAGRAGETYNIGGNCQQENLALIGTLCAAVDRAFGVDAELRARFPACPAARGEPCAGLVELVRDRPGHDRRYAIDARKIARELGFAPRHTLADGLEATVAWWLANEAWWRPALAEAGVPSPQAPKPRRAP